MSAAATYTIGFTVSAQGALAVGDTITTSLPGASGCSGVTVIDVTTGSQGSPSYGGGYYCGNSWPPGSPIPSPIAINNDDQVQVIYTGVSTPATTGAQTVSVYTSVDSAGSGTYTLAKMKPVSGVSAVVSPAIAGVTAAAKYTIGFSVSSQGALAIGKGITVSLPGASGCSGVTVLDVTTGAQGSPTYGGGYNCANSGLPGHRSLHRSRSTMETIVGAIYTGVSTPAKSGAQAVSVSTAFDATGSNTYTLAKQKAVSAVSASVSPESANTVATYTIGFTVSSQGALKVGSGMTVSLPGASGCRGVTVIDVTTGKQGSPSYGGGYNCGNSWPPGSPIPSPIKIKDGNHVKVVYSGVSTPATSGSQTVSVNTIIDSSGGGTYTLQP